MTNYKIPDLLLEKLVASNNPSDNSILESYMKKDSSVKKRINDLKQSNNQILQEYPARVICAGIAEKARQKKVILIKRISLASTVAAAMFLIAIIYPFSKDQIASPKPEEYIGIKGDPQLHIYKKSKDGETALENGAYVSTGDTLQLVFNSSDAQSLAIFSLDGNGVVTLHYPEQKGDSTLVEPGTQVILPYAYELDDAPFFERFFLIWNLEETPISLSQIEKILYRVQAKKDVNPEIKEPLLFKDFLLNKNNVNIHN